MPIVWRVHWVLTAAPHHTLARRELQHCSPRATTLLAQDARFESLVMRFLPPRVHGARSKKKNKKGLSSPENGADSVLRVRPRRPLDSFPLDGSLTSLTLKGYPAEFDRRQDLSLLHI